MFTLTLLREFLQDLRTQKTRAFLTLFAITWGTIAVVLLLSFGEGLKERLITGLLNAGDKIIIVYGGETTKAYQGLPKGRYIQLHEDDIELLKTSIKEIDLISAQYGAWGTRLSYGRNTTTTYSEGVYPTFEEMRRMYPAAGGRFLNGLDLREKRRVVVLGAEMKNRLFGAEEAIGKSIRVNGLPFRVVGVLQKKLQTSMSNGPDDNRAVLPASTFKTIFGRERVNSIVVRPKSVTEAEVVKRELYRILGRKYKFDPEDERALFLWDFVENEKETRKVFLGLQIFLGVVGSFTLIIAGVGVANIMYVVVKERTREIGIKRAVGAKRRHIIGQFVVESLLMALLGGSVGILFSWLIIKGVSMIPVTHPALQYLGKPVLSTPILFGTAAFLGTLGLGAGVFPARRAAMMEPVEALRYE